MPRICSSGLSSPLLINRVIYGNLHLFSSIIRRTRSTDNQNFRLTAKVHSLEAIHRTTLSSLQPFDAIKRCLSTSSQSDDNCVDFAVFGGGVIGSSVAYWLKQRLGNQMSCAVIERDPTYTKCSTTLSVGGIRQQFSVEENIELSLFSSKFLQNIERYLKVSDQEMPHIDLKLNGYLVLATDVGAHQLMANQRLQTRLGADIELLSIPALKSRYPWINTEGLALASYGRLNEGWFDPWALLTAFKLKAQSLGVSYINANIVGFDLKERPRTDGSDKRLQSCNEVIFNKPDGSLNRLSFGTGIVCCGAYSALISQYLNYGSDPSGCRSALLPIEPRKRYVYVIHCPEGPGPQSPLLFDTSGAYFRPEGSSGLYLCGRCPEETAEPTVDNLDVDYDYFDSDIWPQLANRVPAFESIKVKKSWAGLYEYNRLDQNAVVGRDPYYENIYWATGFSGHGIQMSPAVGRALMELIVDNRYATIDLRRFGWQRVLNGQPLKEVMVY